MSVNKVILLGNLGQDPELKYLPSGQPVATFSVATSEKWTDRDGNRQTSTEWTRVTVWGKMAETCNHYISKGSQVYIEGKLKTSSWVDKDGKKQYKTEVEASTVQFIGSNNKTTPKKEDKEESNGDFASDDVPF